MIFFSRVTYNDRMASLDLGSRRLSSLVKEEYLVGIEISHSKRPTGIRSLILKRLPTFLHEHNYAKMRVSLDWLQIESNFQVKVYGQTEVKTLPYGKLRLERNQEASAVAQWGPAQRIELMLLIMPRLIFMSKRGAHGAERDLLNIYQGGYVLR